MRSTSPRHAGSPPAAALGARTRGALAGLGLGIAVVAGLAGCHGEPPPVAPGEPIAAPAEVALGTMDGECDGLIAAFGLFRQCPNLDDDDRGDIDGWIERARQDFAAGKKANPEPNAQHAIAEACRKAVASVNAANQRCHAGPKPRP